MTDSEEKRWVDSIRAISFREARDAGAKFIDEKWVAQRLNRPQGFVRANWNKSLQQCKMAPSPRTVVSPVGLPRSASAVTTRGPRTRENAAQPNVSKTEKRRAIRAEVRKITSESGAARTALPEASLRLQHVFGYRGYDCRDNIAFTPTGRLVYHVAAVGIVLNRETGKQNIYIGHDDDILCLALHPQGNIVATGQVGKHPPIHLWEADTLKKVIVLKDYQDKPVHERGICALSFSATGDQLASVGQDEYHSVAIWDWHKGQLLGTTRGHNDKVFAIKFNPLDSNRFVIAGLKHIKFFTQDGEKFTSSRGVLGSVAKLDSMLCLEFGQENNICYSGSSTGDVYVWNEKNLVRVVKVCEGLCLAITTTKEGFAVGGKDGQVTFWDKNFENRGKVYPITQDALSDGSTLTAQQPTVRAIAVHNNSIVVGTREGELVEISADTGHARVLTQGHCKGEVWGLAPHPTDALCAATASDDHYLRLWTIDSAKPELIALHNLEKEARCVAYSPDGNLIAVGCLDGTVKVLSVPGLQERFKFRHRKEEISDIKFSPGQGSYFAVASHDNFVDIYDTGTGKRVGVCKGASSYVTHIDWDSTGKLLQLNSGAKERLFFEAPSGVRVLDAKDTEWATWTSVLGECCVGIWPPRCDVTDVNATSAHPTQPVLATADDDGHVNLFRFPCPEKHARSRTYSAHSAHVTNVRWASDGSTLLSVGGADTALMVWSCQSAGAETHNGESASDGED